MNNAKLFFSILRRRFISWLLAGYDQKCVEQACYWLDSLRSDRLDALLGDSAVEYVREGAEKGGYPLWRLGTNERELRKLLKKCFRRSAVDWLTSLRGTHIDDSLGKSAVRYVRDYTAKAGCTLRNIGTSEKELDGLLAQSYRRGAEKWLKYLRDGDDADIVKYIREDIEKAGCTLQDIGTSEEDLLQLVLQAHRRAAENWLACARRERGDKFLSRYLRESAIGYVHDYTGKAGVTLQDIGTNQEELSQLLATCK